MLTSVVLIEVAPARDPRDLLLVKGKQPALPSATVPPWERPGTVAFQLLIGTLGRPVPGQRLWLLGYWKPYAVYLAQLPERGIRPASDRLFWYPGQLSELQLSVQEGGWVRRALTWLRDGGNERCQLLARKA